MIIILLLILIFKVLYDSSVMLYNKRKSLLAFVAITFASLNSLGVILAPVTPLEDLSYLTNPFFLIRQDFLEDSVYYSQIFSHSIFMFVIIIGLTIEKSNYKTKNLEYKRGNKFIGDLAWGNLFFLLGILMSIKYFVFGPGINLLINTQFSFESTLDAVAHRSEKRDSVSMGQGSYLASLASKVIFPIAAFFYMKSVQNKKLKYLLVILLLVFSAFYAIQTRQKAPMFGVLIAYALLLITNTKFKDINLKKFVLTPLLAIILGVILYIVNFGLSIKVAIISFFARVFVIPAATEVNFFYVLPNLVPFRGFENILTIPLRSSSELSIVDIAFMATGDYFSSNASFIAISWSGFGYVGVLLVSILFVSILLFLDKLLLKVDYINYLRIVFLLIPSTIGLISGSFLDYIGWGGLVIPLVILTVINLERKLRVK
jgi:hypothetical protein